jgi:hypothetical protein
MLFLNPINQHENLTKMGPKNLNPKKPNLTLTLNFKH